MTKFGKLTQTANRARQRKRKVARQYYNPGTDPRPQSHKPTTPAAPHRPTTSGDLVRKDRAEDKRARRAARRLGNG